LILFNFIHSRSIAKYKRRIMKYLKTIFYLFLIVFIISVLGIGWIFIQVSSEAETHINRGAIEQTIFSESPVYYDDGKSVIGVFFEKVHGKYIHYDDIPRIYIKALLAAEDRNFFKHHGFDLRALARAMLSNLKAGRVVQGGSTLTQQTAKNIFTRQKRSYSAKLKELFQAILLERRYSKEEILEMYINQFFVTGFGKGLRIAAEYYFNKPAEELDLVESAFIAGSVKGPNRYNPFTKKAESEKEMARQFAKERKDYVLRNMYRSKFISEEDYQEARKRDVPFEQGQITYRLNVVLDYVREQLESNEIKKILREQGIENIATSGIKIHTSIDKEIQAAALKTLQKHLTDLDVKLSGYHQDVNQTKIQDLSQDVTQSPREQFPFQARVTQIQNDIENPSLVVSWSKGGGIISKQGILPLAEAWVKWKHGNWTALNKRYLSDFMKQFSVGDFLPVKYESLSNGEKRLLLARVPEIEGGVAVVKQGVIKAMVGGYFNRYYNRAIYAKRQLGSIFKPLVYAAALQLKWNSLDPLFNRRDIFQFESTSYIPLPDHQPRSEKVSMLWAGVKSENLATVWLLYHLTDKLKMNEFRQVAEGLGLNRGDHESYGEYVRRIRDKHGIVINSESLLEAAFIKSKKDVISDLIFSGWDDALDNLHHLHYRIDEKALLSSAEDSPSIEILQWDYSRLQELNRRMADRWEEIEPAISDPIIGIDEKLKRIEHFYLERDMDPFKPSLVYSEDASASQAELEPLTLSWLTDHITGIKREEIRINGLIPSGTLDLLQTHISKNYKNFLGYRKYDFEVLFWSRDFRVLVNLFYVRDLAQRMGIITPLDPVLSFPLGSNAISITEAALAYQCIMTGQKYPFAHNGGSNPVPMITKILDRSGELLYEYRPEPEEIFPKAVRDSANEILRMVVEKGTGRQAREAVKMPLPFEGGKVDLPIPCFGKTGTSNEYRNSSFVGYIPGLTDFIGTFDLNEGYVIAGYVGYDDNRPMKGKNMTIYGASGALPIWIDIANHIVNTKEYRKDLQLADFAFDSRTTASLNGRELEPVDVSIITGLPVTDSHEEDYQSGGLVKTYGNIEIRSGEIILRRVFKPF